MQDIFTRPTETYVRDINLINDYVEDIAKYIQLQTGQDMDTCREFIKTSIAEGGSFPLHDPETMYLERNKLGDREQVRGTFTGYLDQVVANREILAPTLTGYMPPERKHSLLAQYIDGNLDKRKKAKKEMFVATMKGDKILEAIKDGEQSSVKIKNNSLSGAHCSPYTVLFNKSSHSTLTSICRCATSYGNANNERFLYGNRHYWTPDVVKTNIVSILNHTDLNAVELLLKQYKLRTPTIEETMAVVMRSTDPYWRIPDQTSIIESLIKAMKPVERAAFVYTGDFYHLAQFNDGFARSFVKGLSTKATHSLPFEESKRIIQGLSSNLLAHVSIICSKELDGGMIGDAEQRPEDYGIIAATALQIQTTLLDNSDFINLFWVTDNLPPSIFMLPSIIRRGVITSDTDSTIFTVASWTTWYRGQLDFEPESMNVASTMVFLAAELIRHILARVSGNMGVSLKDIRRLSMKNEYYFPVFVLTSRAKHYFARIAAREGNVYKHFETEIKGVALRNSNVPPDIMKSAKSLMLSVMDSIMKCEKISFDAILSEIAQREYAIRKDVESGGYSLMTKGQIKSPDSYKAAERSPYVHYGLWEEVFAPKYGHVEAPPYRAIKVSVDIDSPTKLKEWLAKLEDRALATRMEQWLISRKRNAVTSFMLPEIILMSTGVPKEVVAAIDVRKLISQITEAFYLILESLGIFMRNDDNTRLVSDNGWLVQT
jgi:hypothetical protein